MDFITACAPVPKGGVVMEQLPLNPELIHGADLNRFDVKRLKGQMLDVWRCIDNQAWWTLSEIEAVTTHPQASISAHLRAFRKKKHGLHTVNRQRRFGESMGTWEYQLVINHGGCSHGA